MEGPPAEAAGGGGAVAAFAGEGLRWAFQQLSLRAQVAGVVEEMLATVEVGAWAECRVLWFVWLISRSVGRSARVCGLV